MKLTRKKRTFREAMTTAPVFKSMCRSVRRLAARAAAGKAVKRVPVFEFYPDFPVGLRPLVSHYFNEVIKNEKLDIVTRSERQADGGSRLYVIPVPHCEAGWVSPAEMERLEAQLPPDQWEECN